VLSIDAVRVAVHPGAVAVRSWPAHFPHASLNAGQVDDAGDRRLLLVTASGGVALLHLVGEMARDAPDDDVGDLRLPYRVWRERLMALGEICLVSPMALPIARKGFARAELLRKRPVSEGNRSSLRSISRVTRCLSTCQRRTCITKSGSLMT
jgi:hypothetical protein